MNKIVITFITMPMAIKIFYMDKNSFSVSKVNVVYQELINSALGKLQTDFNYLKRDMYTKHHLDVRYIGKDKNKVKYSVNKNVIEFTPEELKCKTEELMRKYLTNVGK